MKKFTLMVSEPCHENWSAMTPEDKGRYCDSCRKTVVDFTSMSDRQIADYFKHASGSVCGRFYNDQLNREIIVPKKSIPWLKYFFTVTWPAFVLLLKSCGQKNEVMGELMYKNETGFSHPVAGEKEAAATMLGDTTLVKMPPALPSNCTVVKGDVEIVHPDEKRSEWTSAIQNLTLENKCLNELPAMEAPALRSAELPPLTNENSRIIMGGISISSTNRVKHQVPSAVLPPVTIQMLQKSTVTIFPNPVNRNQSLTIKTAKDIKGTYQLMELSGKVMAAGKLLIQSEQTVSIPLPSCAAGVYFLRLLDEETGEIVTEKIIVQ